MNRFERYFNNEPRFIRAKFNSKCHETGRKINKGEECLYYPISKQIYCIESNEAYEYRNMIMDEEVL